MSVSTEYPSSINNAGKVVSEKGILSIAIPANPAKISKIIAKIIANEGTNCLNAMNIIIVINVAPIIAIHIDAVSYTHLTLPTIYSV